MFIFYSHPNNSKRTTVVGQQNGDKFQIAVAMTSNKDNFIKSLGREIASGRLKAGKIYKEIPTIITRSEDFIQIAEEIVVEVKTKSLQYKKLYNKTK